MTWTFNLYYPKPPRGLSANDRAHWRIKNDATQAVRAEVMWQVRALKVPVIDRARVDVVWVVKDQRRRDTDNLAPMLKAIYDGIGADKGISAHVLEDDAPEFMEKPGATIRYEKGTVPHFEVTITDLSDAILTGTRGDE